jgi:asparagine synthase (glutamine-hydrolysing)
LPDGIRIAPKRPLQTPQREWLAGPLRVWANDCIEEGLQRYGGEWLDADLVRREWRQFQLGASDNSYYVWQWISVGLFARNRRTSASAEAMLS